MDTLGRFGSFGLPTSIGVQRTSESVVEPRLGVSDIDLFELVLLEFIEGTYLNFSQSLSISQQCGIVKSAPISVL